MSTVDELAEKVRQQMRRKADELRDLADALEQMATAYRPSQDYDDLRRACPHPAAADLELYHHYSEELKVDMSHVVEAIVACNDEQMEHEEALAEARWDRRVAWASGDN